MCLRDGWERVGGGYVEGASRTRVECSSCMRLSSCGQHLNITNAAGNVRKSTPQRQPNQACISKTQRMCCLDSPNLSSSSSPCPPHALPHPPQSLQQCPGQTLPPQEHGLLPGPPHGPHAWHSTVEDSWFESWWLCAKRHRGGVGRGCMQSMYRSLICNNLSHARNRDRLPHNVIDQCQHKALRSRCCSIHLHSVFCLIC